MRIHEFNPSAGSLPVHLAHANGFPPETYTSSLCPLFSLCRVFSIYARPFLGDTPPSWLRNWEQMADDLLAGLEASNVKRVVGIGHSMGGVVTLYAAVRRPDLFEKVVLIDPTMPDPSRLRKIKWMRFFGLEARKDLVRGALRRRKEWGSREEAFRYFREKLLFRKWSEEILWAYVRGMTTSAETGGVRLLYPAEWEARIYRTIPTNVWEFAALLSVPVLVLRGEGSQIFTNKSEAAFRRLCPAAKFATVEGAGHLIPQEKPEKVGELLARFMIGERETL